MVVKRYLNYLRYKMYMRSNIIGLRFTVTWKCNSKCTTCAIWKDRDAGRDELNIEQIYKFSKSKYFRKTEYITISGGEPILRQDLPEIISVLHRNIPTARFSITTNGMDPQAEEAIFRRIFKDNPNIKFGLVGISLNGPADIHDLTRGIRGSWAKAVETYERLKNIVPCEFSFTFCKDNVDYFEWAQNFAENKKTNAYICWTVMNSRFHITDEDLIFWKAGMEKILEKYLERRFGLDRSFLNRIKKLINASSGVALAYLYDNIVNKRIMPCFAGSQIVHIDPQGNVYPCNFKMTKDRMLGNLREGSFDKIWKAVPKGMLKEIAEGQCMYPNGLCGDSDIYPSICNSPSVVLKWYLGKLIRRESLVELYKKDE